MTDAERDEIVRGVVRVMRQEAEQASRERLELLRRAWTDWSPAPTWWGIVAEGSDCVTPREAAVLEDPDVWVITDRAIVEDGWKVAVAGQVIPFDAAVRHGLVEAIE